MTVLNKENELAANALEKLFKKSEFFTTSCTTLPRASSRLHKGYRTNCIILLGFRQSLKDKVFNNFFVQFLYDFDVEL